MLKVTDVGLNMPAINLEDGVLSGECDIYTLNDGEKEPAMDRRKFVLPKDKYRAEDLKIDYKDYDTEIKKLDSEIKEILFANIYDNIFAEHRGRGKRKQWRNRH